MDLEATSKVDDLAYATLLDATVQLRSVAWFGTYAELQLERQCYKEVVAARRQVLAVIRNNEQPVESE